MMCCRRPRSTTWNDAEYADRDAPHGVLDLVVGGGTAAVCRRSSSTATYCDSDGSLSAVGWTSMSAARNV